jgi:hypothetical protein
MTHVLASIILSVIMLLPDAWEQTLDTRDGMSYIHAAEDITALGIHSIDTRDLVTHLYVIAAITDPHLRDSAILGLISIESDEDLKLKLHSMEHHTAGLLVSSVISNRSSSSASQSDSIDSLCSTLTSLRKGKTVSIESANELRPWGYLFDGGFDRFMQAAKQRRRSLTQETIESTLRVELAVLGGPALWSADYAATSGKPVALTLNDDLATMFNVDPTKRLRKNGAWVTR